MKVKAPPSDEESTDDTDGEDDGDSDVISRFGVRPADVKSAIEAEDKPVAACLRPVVFGMRSFIRGVANHYAMQVGDTWHEVAGTSQKRGPYPPNKILTSTGEKSRQGAEPMRLIGYTTKSDAEVKHFNDNWIKRNPSYDVHRHIGQKYAQELIEWLGCKDVPKADHQGVFVAAGAMIRRWPIANVVSSLAENEEGDCPAVGKVMESVLGSSMDACRGSPSCRGKHGNDSHRHRVGQFDPPPRNPPGDGSGGRRRGGNGDSGNHFVFPGNCHSLGGVEFDLQAYNFASGAHKQRFSDSRSSILFHFDEPTGLLFQLPFSLGNGMAFTDVEMGTILQWCRAFGHSSIAAFSLDPTDPKQWELAKHDSAQQLFQRKWYSHQSLKNTPLGYWMWRADWKLKQLSQGMLHDDRTGQQRPIKLGVDVPHDFPDMSQRDGDTGGVARLWIVCRRVTLRPVGSSSLHFHPDDVSMGVEVRAMQFNPRTNTYEDSVVSKPCTALSRFAAYMSDRYDELSSYVPELQHCKRMAALLAVAQWLFKGPARSSKLTLEHISPKFKVPRDFADNSVPQLRAVYEKGQLEEERVHRLRTRVERLRETWERRIAEEKRRVSVAKQDTQLQRRRSETAQITVDRYSQVSVDACNEAIHSYNACIEQERAAVEQANAAIHQCNTECSAATAECNAAVAVCNAVRSTLTVFGGVDLNVGSKVDVKPASGDEAKLRNKIRPWAEELRDNAFTSMILDGKIRHDAPVSLDQDVAEQQRVLFNVFPVAARPDPQLIPWEAKTTHVFVHGLQNNPELNFRSGVLQCTIERNGRYEVVVAGQTVSLKRENFTVLGTPLRLVGLDDCMLNGQCGRIVNLVASKTGMRYEVQVKGGVLVVQPKNTILPKGCSASVIGLQNRPEYNGSECKLIEVCPEEYQMKSNAALKPMFERIDRRCVAQLHCGQTLHLSLGNLLA